MRQVLWIPHLPDWAETMLIWSWVKVTLHLTVVAARSSRSFWSIEQTPRHNHVQFLTENAPALAGAFFFIVRPV